MTKKLTMVPLKSKVAKKEEPFLTSMESVVNSSARYRLEAELERSNKANQKLAETVEKVLGSQEQLSKDIVEALKRPQVKGFTLVTPEGLTYSVSLER